MIFKKFREFAKKFGQKNEALSSQTETARTTEAKATLDRIQKILAFLPQDQRAQVQNLLNPENMSSKDAMFFLDQGLEKVIDGALKLIKDDERYNSLPEGIVAGMVLQQIIKQLNEQNYNDITGWLKTNRGVQSKELYLTKDHSSSELLQASEAQGIIDTIQRNLSSLPQEQRSQAQRLLDTERMNSHDALFVMEIGIQALVHSILQSILKDPRYNTLPEEAITGMILLQISKKLNSTKMNDSAYWLTSIRQQS